MKNFIYIAQIQLSLFLSRAICLGYRSMKRYVVDLAAFFLRQFLSVKHTSKFVLWFSSRRGAGYNGLGCFCLYFFLT